MDQSLEREIRRLYSCFHSSEDRQGRSFVPLADAYRRAGDLLRARLLLEEGLRRHPGFASAHVVAMRIARDVSDHAGALAATRRVLELDPDNVEAQRVLARVGPLARDEGRSAVSGARGRADAEVPDESWMVGDAGVWAAGTDSGLASVDPVALEAEEGQAAAMEAGEEQPAMVAGEGQATTEEPTAPGSKKGAGRSVPATGIPSATPTEASDAVEAAGIYTRTMGQLYEQQGLHAEAIAVYERLIESHPDDEALASRLERLRRRPRDEGSRSAPAAREPAGDSPGIESTGTRGPADLARSAAAGEEEANAAEAARGGEPAKTAGVVPVPGDSMRVVPIEALAPDAPVVGAREEAP